jgi:hypothetical protein
MMPQDPFAAIAQPAKTGTSDPFAAIAEPAAPSVQKPSLTMSTGEGPIARNMTSFETQLSQLPKNTVRLLLAKHWPIVDSKNTTELWEDIKSLNPVMQQYEGGPIDYGATAANLLPALVDMKGGGITTSPAVESVRSGLSKVGEFRKATAEAAQPLARKVTGVEPAVKEAVTKAAENQATAIAERPAELKEHVAKITDIKKANTEAETLHTRKAALDSGIDKLSGEFGEQLNALDKKVRAEADANYAKVREKVGDETVSRQTLADAAMDAEGKLRGSEENLKVFRDIFKSVEQSPLGEAVQSVPVGFDDLHGYYSELGERLSGGNLPGDVYQATKALRDSIGGMMQTMADNAGAKEEFNYAQKFYHDYMTTFRDSTGPSGSGSPVAQSRVAKDPAYIRKPFTGDSGNRGVEMLAKYSPELAKRARAIAKYETESAAIPGKAPKAKEIPTVPPKVETPTVDVGKVARDAIATRAKNWGTFNARDVGILSSSILLEPIVKIIGGGQGASNLLPAAALGYEGGKFYASRILNKPSVIEWLAKTPPEEAAVLAKIPGADKVKIVDGLTQVAIESGKPVSLSPAARTLLGPSNTAKILAVTGASQVRNRKDAINVLNRPASQ